MATLYKGYRELILNDDELADFYSGLYEFPSDIVENEYVLIKNQDSITINNIYPRKKYFNINYFFFVFNVFMKNITCKTCNKLINKTHQIMETYNNKCRKNNYNHTNAFNYWKY